MLLLCGFAPAGNGAGEPLAGSPRPDAAGWITLADPVRVTFYGSRYVAGDVTASGIRYAPDDDVAALGLELLDGVRDHYARRAADLGWTLTWERTKRGRLDYWGAFGAFPVATGWKTVTWWGHLVRICAERSLPAGQKKSGGELCWVVRVADTGGPGLQVDLPDETWARWGWPAERGVFAGRLEVLE